MKILYAHYLTQADHPAIHVIENISNQLREMGHDVRIYASAGIKHAGPTHNVHGAATNSDSATVMASIANLAEGLKQKIKGYGWFLKAMARNRRQYLRDAQVLQDVQPDIVLTRQDAYCWSVMSAARKAGYPVVTYADAPVAYEARKFSDKRWHPPGLVEAIERWGIKNSRSVVTVSHPAARVLSRYKTGTMIHVSHNGADPERFPARSETEKNDIRRSLGIKTKLVIGFQGSFRTFHGVNRMGEIIRHMSDMDVTWLLVGDGPERKQLASMVRGSDKVVFAGHQDYRDMGRLLSVMDIAIAPHRQMKGEFYFCPLKIIEYAASGCAILTTNQGDIPMLLANGEAAEFVEQNSLSEWICSLSKLISDEALRKRLGRTAREHALRQFPWRRTAETIERVLCHSTGVMPPSRQPPEDAPQEPIEERILESVHATASEFVLREDEQLFLSGAMAGGKD